MSINERDREPFTYKIVEHLCVLGKGKAEGFKKEFNYVAFNGAEAKWDIRDWNSDHTKMSKGITLTNNEMRTIMDIMVTQTIGEKQQEERNKTAGKAETQKTVQGAADSTDSMDSAGLFEEQQMTEGNENLSQSHTEKTAEQLQS